MRGLELQVAGADPRVESGIDLLIDNRSSFRIGHRQAAAEGHPGNTMPTLPASSESATPRLTVIIVNIPYLHGDASLLLAGALAGVQQIFGADAVVTLDLPIVFEACTA